MNLSDWFSALWDVAFLRVLNEPALALPDLESSTFIALAAGISTLLGHSAILFINRVKGLRFAAALLVGVIFLTLLLGIQGAVLWIIAPFITGTHVEVAGVLALTLAATAPQIYGVLCFIPHLGLLIGRVLQGWSGVCLWLLAMVSYSTTWWQALIATTAAWLLMQLVSRLLSRPVGAVAGRLWCLVTGTPAMLQARDVLVGAPFVPVESKVTS